MCGSATRTIRTSRRASSPRTMQYWSTAWSASRNGSAATSPRPPRREKSWDCSGRSDLMLQRSLGRSDIKVSVVGVGCNNFGRRIHDVAQARAVVHRALDLGITLFDTADAYGGGT